MTGAVLTIILGACVLATLAVVSLIAWSLGVLRQPRALVRTGQWRDAALAAERLGASWLRIFPSVREEAAYARASCLHLEGKLEESLAAILPLSASSRSPIAGAVALLEGANLVLSRGDARRAVRCLSAASEPSEDLLLLALAQHAAGETEAAEVTFARAGRTRPKNAPSPRIYEPAFHYLRGLYLVETSRAGEAAADLAAAAASPMTTIYVERAKALLHEVPAREDPDPRSSLAPQVIDE